MSTWHLQEGMSKIISKVLCGIIRSKNITAHQNIADNMVVDRDSVLNTTDPVLEMPL